MARSDHHRTSDSARYIPHAQRLAQAEAWDSKTRKLIFDQIEHYVRRYADMMLEFPTSITLFAKDWDLLRVSRYNFSRRHEVELIRGPSRQEYVA